MLVGTPAYGQDKYAPTADDLEAFAGRYESDELRAVLEMAPKKDGLMGRLNDSPAQSLEFKPRWKRTVSMPR